MWRSLRFRLLAATILVVLIAVGVTAFVATRRTMGEFQRYVERRSPLDAKKLKRPPFKFKKLPGSDMRELVTPDRKKYAAYYQALEEHARLENDWYEEDQRNLHRLIDVRGFLWT